ncbi:MAG TPA: type II CAAX endopeptidase family protein [Polyangiales bacterium]|nr:type II CAAX endopeptidase family protein [Polyangiales bacterium]
MTTATETSRRTPNGLRQFRILIRLWWLQMRRRPMRVGEAPKISGAPTFLLISVLSAGYLAMIAWQSVARNVKEDPGRFTWHMLGVLLLGFATGLSRGAGKLQVRGTRNDAFLETLPLRTLARLGLQFIDTFTFIPLTLTGVLAAMSVHGTLGSTSIVAALLGTVAFMSCYVMGAATIAWVRALGPASAGLWGGYTGLALSIVAMLAMFVPLGQLWVGDPHSISAQLADAWVGPSPMLLSLYVGFLGLGFGSYRVLAAANRFGIDQLDPQIRAPKQSKGFRGRVALERLMMMRQGGRALLILYVFLVGGALSLLATPVLTRLPASSFIFVTGFAIYLGALQTIGQAARAARADQQARPFLAALPMSPHQVLDGKARALRLLLIPVLVLLVVLAVASLLRADSSYTYRIVLSLLALYVLVDGAVSIAFLSTGIGVLGIGGSQSTTGYSTQILMLPLFATVLAPNDWAATTACIATLAVSFESRRAARMNVRWIDDPADDVERETTVWRALLAASAFFAMQALSYRILSLFDLPMGYTLALSFASSAVLLGLLTWRNDARIDRPRFLPNHPSYWLLGVLAGTTSGLLAREFAKLIPPPADAADLDFSGGELAAMGVMMTVIAPLVEEYFFRGWLQRAIAADLPADRKKWAFAIGASAFALAHFGTYGVPQLILGLLAGWLFARGGGLWPSIVAHALHNGVVLLLGE